MNKYNIGDEISISGKIKITGVQSKLDGSTIYQIANIPALELDKMAAPAKPIIAPKPAFVEGGYAKVTGNTNHHQFKIGETIKLIRKYNSNNVYWDARKPNGEGFTWCVRESDMTPCEAPKAKAEPPKTEPVKQEPVKLYCVKSYRPGEWITQGKVYEADAQFHITFDDGYKNSGSFASLKDLEERNPSFAACLCKLVRRPAKVGEWVYIQKAAPIQSSSSYKNGDIFKVKSDHAVCASDIYVDGVNEWIDYTEYLVLDGYQPEPAEPPKQPEKPANLVDRDAKVGEKIYIIKAFQSNGTYKNGDVCEVKKVHEHVTGGVYVKSPTGKSNTASCESGTTYVNRSEYLVVEEKPKYYNGKVICTNKKYPGSATVSDFTVGKTYNIIDGCITSDDGYISDHYVSIECLCQGMGSTFIPAVD